MGFFSKLSKAIKSKANNAIDSAISPEKEVDLMIEELEEQRRAAIQELISYKATSKEMQQEIDKYEAKTVEWERRAMAAVKAGDDEMAKTALREKKRCAIEVTKITNDRDEAASYAIELNRSRKKFDTKLKMLKLKKGTLATQLAVSRSSSNNAFGHDDDVWERFERAEDRIENEAIAAEVDAAMEGEELYESEFDAKLLAAGGDLDDVGTATAEDPLLALKAKMAEQKEQKLLAAHAAYEATKSGDEGSDE
jgi:phage shock protein A